MRLKCSGHTTAGNPCGAYPIHGGTVCNKHGGSAPQVKAKAAANVALAQAEGLLARYGNVEAVTDPLHELLMVAGRCKRLMLALDDRVNELGSLRYASEAGEQLRAEVTAYMTMLDRCRAVLVDIVRLDIWDRLAKVEERQVEMFAKALDKAMADAGHPELASEVKGHVARHLRVAAG